MKVAFTSPNGKTIAGHAGKCPGYVVMQLDENKVLETTRVKLEKQQVFSQFSGSLLAQTGHPLQGINMLVTLSCGEGLQKRLSADGVEVVITQEETPDVFIEKYLHQ